jgi:hypothetical protein
MATTGRPAIPIPGALDLRVIQQSIGNIAERLRQIDAQVALLNSYATGSKSAAEIQQLRQQIAALSAQIEAPATVEITADADAALLFQSLLPRPEPAARIDDAQRAIFDAAMAPRELSAARIDDAQRAVFDAAMAPRANSERQVDDMQQLLAAQSFQRR